MRTSVCKDGACNSPGRHCMKSLKTAAVFQTSSSILPSITGGLSKRVSLTGLIFSAVRSSASRASALAGSDAKRFEDEDEEVPAAGVAPAPEAEFAAGVAPAPELVSLAGAVGAAGGG